MTGNTRENSKSTLTFSRFEESGTDLDDCCLDYKYLFKTHSDEQVMRAIFSYFLRDDEEHFVWMLVTVIVTNL